MSRFFNILFLKSLCMITVGGGSAFVHAEELAENSVTAAEVAKTPKKFETNFFRFGAVYLHSEAASASYSQAFSNWHFAWSPVFHLGKRLDLVPQVGVAVGKSLPHTNFLIFELSDGLRFHVTEYFGMELFGGFQSWLNEVGTFGIVGVGADYRFSRLLFNAFDEIHLSYTHFRKEISQSQWKLALRFSF